MEETTIKKNNLITFILQEEGHSINNKQGELAGKKNTYEKRKKELNKLTITELQKIEEPLDIKAKKRFKFLETRTQIKANLMGKHPDRKEATEIVTKYILEKENIYTTRGRKTKESWIYKEGIYIPEAQSYVEELCRKFFEEYYSTHLKNDVLAKIDAETYIKEEEFFNNQDKHPHLIPVQNGILNLNTKELKPFTPKIYFFNKINAHYEEKATCPAIKQFIKEITANETDIKTIQELFGFILYKEYFIEKAIMFYGSNGRNGKSKLLQIMTEFLGIENTSSVGLQKLEDDPFSKANLFGKMVNISADISNQAMQHTGEFKSVTGRDPLQANRKFKSYISFVNYAKMIFASNELPMIYTATEAFWLRWIIIEFPYQFLPKKELMALKGEEMRLARLQNPNIIQQILTPKELNGLLNWAIEGLDRLKDQKDFSDNQTAGEIRANWLRRSSSVNAFCEDHIVEDYDSHIEKSVFQRRYSQYCKQHKIKAQSGKVIKITLENEYGASEKRLSDGERPRVWDGVNFKNEDLSQMSMMSLGISPYTKIDKFSYRGKSRGQVGQMGQNDDSYLKEYSLQYSDLINLGWSESQIKSLLTSGDLFELKPGTYCFLTNET